jgi:hypothetical protein
VGAAAERGRKETSGGGRWNGWGFVLIGGLGGIDMEISCNILGFGGTGPNFLDSHGSSSPVLLIRSTKSAKEEPDQVLGDKVSGMAKHVLKS